MALFKFDMPCSKIDLVASEAAKEALARSSVHLR